MLHRKLYYLTPHLNSKITCMRPSPTPGQNPLILLTKALATLPLAILTLVLLPATPPLLAQSVFASANNLTVAEQYLLAAANEARASQGLTPLRLDPVLTAASAAPRPRDGQSRRYLPSIQQ